MVSGRAKDVDLVSGRRLAAPLNSLRGGKKPGAARR
jgi:hypothetical protein